MGGLLCCVHFTEFTILINTLKYQRLQRLQY